LVDGAIIKGGKEIWKREYDEDLTVLKGEESRHNLFRLKKYKQKGRKKVDLEGKINIVGT